MRQLLAFAAALAVMGAFAMPAFAGGELRYSYGTLDTSVGAVPVEDRLRIKGYPGAMAFSVPVHTLTWVNDLELLFEILEGAAPRDVDMAGGVAPVGAAGFGPGLAPAADPPTRAPGEIWQEEETGQLYRMEQVATTRLSYSWGNGQGGTYSGQAGNNANSVWMWDFALVFPVMVMDRLQLVTTWDVKYHGYKVEDLAVTLPAGVPGRRDYSGGSLQSPFMFKLAGYPLPWLSVGPVVGYDLANGLFSLLVQENGYPRQGVYYGLEADVLLFDHLHLNGAWRASRINLDMERALDQTQLYGGLGFQW